MATDKAIRLVAYFEAAKALLVLAAGTGLLSLVNKDVYAFAAMLIEHAHLDPASKYPQIFLDAAAKVGNSRLLMLAAGALLYSLFHLVEAYGLYYERTWAELLAAISAAIYVPFEITGLIHKPTLHAAVLLVVNLAVVALLVRALLRRRSAKSTAS
ncbi:MAG TPA: DUF2127 domain-containing protein [Steroidobacteraceae bacterium]|nr:DUF2127 domain-containing protein [Steroidobacteraceae bacterium]